MQLMTLSFTTITIPESITTVAGGQTWLGDNFDSVLLYGSLVEAYTYMKGEPDVMAFYDGKYKEALALASRLGDGLERSDAYRSGQYRQAPLPQNNGGAIDGFYRQLLMQHAA
jgi:hypothetical protein